MIKLYVNVFKFICLSLFFVNIPLVHSIEGDLNTPKLSLANIKTSANNLSQLQLAKINVSAINETEYLLIFQYAKLALDIDNLQANALVEKPSPSAWLIKQATKQGIEINKGENFFTFKLTNTSSEPSTVYFTFKNQFKVIEQQLFLASKVKQLTPIKVQTNGSGLNVASITVPAYTDVSLYFMLKSDAAINLPIKFIGEDKLFGYISQLQYENGFVIGGMMFLATITLLLFFSIGSIGFLYIFGYFICRALLLSALLGGNLYYIFPNMPELRMIELPVLSTISLFFLLLFSQSLFEIKIINLKLHKTFNLVLGFLVIMLVCSLFSDVMMKYNLGIFTEILGGVLITAVGISLIRKSQPLGLFITVNVLVYYALMIIAVYYLHYQGVVNIDQDSVYFGAIFWFNVLLVTLTISKKYYSLIQDRHEIQQKSLESAIAAKKANDKLLALERVNQEELEIHVQERTLELSIALQELENSNRELELKNTQDALSGLFNRRYYDKKILAEYRRSKRNLTPLSLVLIDIDHFKRVNDTHGHLAGDHCLVWLGEKIQDSLKRSTDIGCRYGGEEFCLILPDTDAEGADALAEELRHSVADKPCIYQEISIDITISCGISTYLQQDDIEPEQLFSGADKALYASKKAGRNQIQHHVFANTSVNKLSE